MNPLITLTQVEKTIPDGASRQRVLFRDVTFQVEPGQSIAITGKSGTGKTSLLNLLGLFDQVSDGQFEFFSQEASELSDQARARLRSNHLGYVLQEVV